MMDHPEETLSVYTTQQQQQPIHHERKLKCISLL